MSTVGRLHAILAMFRDDKPEWRQADLARELGISQSTLSRNLASMTRLGLLRYQDDFGTYALGPTIVSLAGTAINNYDEFRNSYSEMHSLMSRTQLGTNLGVLNGESVMYLMHIDGPKMHRSITLIGRHVPLHATALGKVILAGMDDEAVRRLAVDDRLAAFTVNTITDAEALAADLTAVRRRGYAMENEELALGRGCIAAPIRGGSGEVVASLSLSGPKDAIRLAEQESVLAGLLLDVTDRISGKLGYIAGANPRVVAGQERPAGREGGTRTRRWAGGRRRRLV